MYIQPLSTGFALKSNDVFGFDFYYWNDWPWTLEIFNTVNCKAQNRSTFKIKTVTMIQCLLFLASDITASHEISHRSEQRKLMFIKYLVKKMLYLVVEKTGTYDSSVTSVIYWALCWEKIYVFSAEHEAGSNFSCNRE